MKSKLGVSVLSLIVLLALMGCGVSESDYNMIEYKNTVLEESNQALKVEAQELSDNMDKMELLSYENNATIAILTDNITVALGEITELKLSISELESEKEALQSQVIEQEERANQAELEISEVSVPGDFPSRSVLQQWADNNIQPEAPNLEGWFQTALIVQRQGLEDGYLISVVYDLDDTQDSTDGWVYCAALAGGRYYLWDHETGDVFDYGDFLERENGV